MTNAAGKSTSTSQSGLIDGEKVLARRVVATRSPMF